MQSRAHGVRRSGNELTSAMSALATSLAVALKPRDNSSGVSPRNASGSTTPPQGLSSHSGYTPVKTAQLKTIYIKELHSLVDVGAIDNIIV